ncbi:hypothetical protein NG798_13600 [Ancylothrix sp. C2]|uniref:hypothetical protein n=1 Tax=Ancylothrix sp. D3o TaxID=2953691 RepID=UPI0021BA4155|nr:hypothetical protein [Ancylothrix sp. D3o]MCT7950829.1 hypothetical protein [Ancylothrix sp. D3o]
MLKKNLITHSLTATAVLILAACSTTSPPKKPVTTAPAPPTVPQPDFFSEGVRSAIKASNLAQTAKTPQQLNDVALAWLKAVEYMQKVPPHSPKRAFAQKKAAEYLQNFTIAQKKAAKSDLSVSFPTFNSHILDQQLALYLSYLAAVGKADILIVGSSRALQGINPKSLQQSLATRGYSGLQIYNFSVNGATAQVVDFMLRKLLKPEQLPRMIIWADGVRAFNSGRLDRTYQAILSSPGYERLVAGIYPSLGELTSISVPNNQDSFRLTSFNPIQTALGQKKQSEIINQIDSNGFLPILSRFNPSQYYQINPKVSGQFDKDYAELQLDGEQKKALDNIVKFTQSLKITLLFVNLPLTDDYLDTTRYTAEQKFVQKMQQESRQQSFLFRNLSLAALRHNNYFQDPSHINSDGAAAVARQLAADSSIPWPKR